MALMMTRIELSRPPGVSSSMITARLFPSSWASVQTARYEVAKGGADRATDGQY